MLAGASAEKRALQTVLVDATHRLVRSDEAVARLHEVGDGHCVNH